MKQKLSDYIAQNGDREIDWKAENQYEKYYLSFSHSTNVIEIFYTYHCQTNLIHFTSKKNSTISY